jgi:chromosome segregation ATPase
MLMKLWRWLRPNQQQSVAMLLERILEETQKANRTRDCRSERIDKQIEALECATETIVELTSLMRREPFAALKTWIDRAPAQVASQRKEYRDREQQLLDRWKDHTEALKEQIAVLQQELLNATK